MTPLPEVLIVVVNWNGKDDLMKCLASIKKSDYPKDRYQVMVVDNASNDGSQEAVTQDHPDVILLKNEKNMGYVKAVNRGVAYGMSSGADYIWIFNNDVVVESDTLKRLVEVGRQDETIGVIAPVIYSYDNRQMVNNTGYDINFWTGRLKKLRYGKDVFTDPGTSIEDVDTILGCSNLIRTSVFKKIGQLRAAYELYFEETDFNIRAKRSGFRIVVAKEAKVWHKEASTMNKFIFRRAYLLLRNLLIFELHNAEWKHLLVFIPYYFLMHLPYFLIRGTIYGLKVRIKGL